MIILFWSAAITDAFGDTPGLEKPWLKLLHYKKDTFGSGWTSQVDDPEFFLSSDGKTNPQGEWLAFIERSKTEAHLKCRFPARTLLADQMSARARKSLESCEDYQKFRSYLSAQSVSLVFSSYFLNNPSSAFGHSFLRFNQWTDSAKPELLDHAIDFAANVDTNNALVYGVKGIFGLFRGTFSLKPYFLKVREYSAFQSRDLWSYRLKFSADEVDYLIAHLWEIGQSWIDYFYFDENCAYHILGVLEVVRPELDLTDELPAYVIPIDTIHRLRRHQLLEDPDYRPSLKTTIDYRLKSLTKAQTQQVADWTDLDRPLPAMTASTDAESLDAALDYLSYRSPFDVQFVSSPAAKRKSELGRIRASVRTPSPSLVIPLPDHERPDRVHPTSIISLIGGSSELDNSFVAFRWRPVFHDFLDPVAGFPRYAAIEFFDTTLRWNLEPKTFWLEDLTVFQVHSLSPWEGLDRPVSWHLKVGAATATRDLCPDCLLGSIEGGAGLSLNTFTLLVEGEASLHPDLPGAWGAVAGGPTFLARLPEWRGLGLLFQAHYRYRLFINRARHDTFARLSLRYSLNRSLALIAEGSIRRLYPEGRLEVRFYF